MRKFIISLVAVAVIGAGSAFAQSNMWVGASTGYPLGLTFYVGFDDLIAPDVDLRANLAGTFASAQGVSAFGVQLGADVLFDFDPIAGAILLNPYAGGGAIVALAGVAGGGGSAGGFGIYASGVAGVEYLIVEELGVFLEARAGVGYFGASGVGGIAPLFGLSLGVNYHF
jgi:hypothetical protein